MITLKLFKNVLVSRAIVNVSVKNLCIKISFLYQCFIEDEICLLDDPDESVMMLF